jgi:hypothetical protein
MQLSPSGPRVSIRHADGQILLLVHRPQHTPLSYLRDTFSVNPVTVETVDAIKAASEVGINATSHPKE